MNLSLDEMAERIERHPRVILVGSSFLYFLGFGALAYSKALSSDEIFSLYVSRLATVPDILRALAQGADTHPPLHYLLLHAVHLFLGESSLAGRFPFLLAIWAMGLFVYGFVTKRCSPLYGFIAALMCWLTSYANTACLSRPYALLLCWYAAALWFWQAAEEGPRKKFFLMGLVMSVTLAITTHFYGVFIMLPIVAGEGWRSYDRRRLDFQLLGALAVGCSSILLFLPQMRIIRHLYTAVGLTRTSTVTSPTLDKLWITYSDMLQPALWMVLAGMIAAACLKSSSLKNKFPKNVQWEGFQGPEVAAASTMVSMPCLLYLIGKFVTGAYGSGYGYMVALGFSILTTHATFILFENKRRPTLILLSCLFLGFSIQQIRTARQWRTRFWYRYEVSPVLLKQESGVNDTLPIVVSQLIPFLQLSYYATPPVASRLCYLNDSALAARFGDPTPDLALAQLHRWVPLALQDYQSFLQEHSSFLVYDWGFIPSWLLPALMERQAHIEIIDRDGPHHLLKVTLKPL
jgi:hypothetical protein